jgi:hypothetical protein
MAKKASKKSPRAAAQTLTQACSKLLERLEKDLRAAVEGDDERLVALKAEHKAAKDAGRTAATFNAWLDDLLTQVGASWILSCVFARFVEDNGFVAAPAIAGRLDEDAAKSRLRQAEAAEQAYYASHPAHGEIEYLEHVFGALAQLPGMADLFDRRHAMLWRVRPRIEGARELLAFFRAVDETTGALRWDFTRDAAPGEPLDTRFLGDLYQDLSASARETYALLQTPDFVESFILDRTLEPALDTFGLEGFRMIDPTCGSGHFLLGAFTRILERHRRAAPGAEPRDLVRQSLGSVYGVDVNPFAVAIARFRLLLAGLRACGVERLTDAPDFHLNLVVADSLFHGKRFAEIRGTSGELFGESKPDHVYSFEISADIQRILGQQYHAVVGNPPYITPKDQALNEAYRSKYGSCYRQYALSVPFVERFLEFAFESTTDSPAGFVGQITSNSFMKREFGKRLIETYFPLWDLTHVIDTSGAYIPGHGTPTVVLFLRHQRPRSSTVRAVMGIRGEPSTPTEPSEGRVWQSILEFIDRPDSESEFVSVVDIRRSQLGQHPWSFGGGGASDLKELVESRCEQVLGDLAAEIGFGAVTREDSAFASTHGALRRAGLTLAEILPFIEGDRIRDWVLTEPLYSHWPYQFESLEPVLSPKGQVRLWPLRTPLSQRVAYGQNQIERGLVWFEYSMFFRSRFQTPLSIAFAFVATHNHFVLDRGGKVFKQSAPVIKLPPGATEEEHLELLGYLNSSLACFWMKTQFHNKGDSTDSEGARVSGVDAWVDSYEFAGTGMQRLPIVNAHTREQASELERLAAIALVAARDMSSVEVARATWSDSRRASIALQEELDWSVYRAAGLVGDELLSDTASVPPLSFGERAFEIVLARRIASGQSQSTWFERHSGTPVTQIPSTWPKTYAEVVERRIKAIESDRSIGLLEQPEYKRRWTTEPFEVIRSRHMTGRMLDVSERVGFTARAAPQPMTCRALTDLLDADSEAGQVRVQLDELGWRGDESAIERSVASEAVPFLSVLRFKPSGLRKRADWEETWRLQRLEDPFLDEQDQLLHAHFGSTPADQRRAREHVACWKTSNRLSKEKNLSAEAEAQLRALKQRWMEIDAERRAAIGGDTPPVPPKYDSKDFVNQRSWSLRGKLDVPKERFISYPGCSPDGDDSLLIGWAGWDHLQRAQALAHILQARKNEGWSGERLVPMLAGLLELLPWLEQWHGEDGAEYRGYLEGECAQAGVTFDDLRAWRP